MHTEVSRFPPKSVVYTNDLGTPLNTTLLKHKIPRVSSNSSQFVSSVFRAKQITGGVMTSQAYNWPLGVRGSSYQIQVVTETFRGLDSALGR